MKVKIIGLVMLCVVSFVPIARARQQLPECTNYGCMVLDWMSQVLTGYPNPGGQGCVKFSVGTGRKVRNASGWQGDDPSTLGGIQDIDYDYFPCNTCTPPIGNGIAIEGAPPNQALAYVGTFGRYTCPVIGGGGGPF